MPLYEYECQDCGKEFELLVSMNSEDQPCCPGCGSVQLKKLISKVASGKKDCSACNGSCCSSCSGCH